MILPRPLLLLALLVLAVPAFAQRLSPLAPQPDWSQLEAFQESITHDEFVRLLEGVYAPAGAAEGMIDVQTDAALIKTTLTPPAEFRLRFAKDSAAVKAAPHFWRTPSQLGAAPTGQALVGVKIALDPGHLGGAWAQMEERYYKIGDTVPVAEGDMTLRVARLLAPELRDLGADVVWVRDQNEPVTTLRPAAFREIARSQLTSQGFRSPPETYPSDGLRRAGRIFTVQWQSELLFLRNSEIGSRARRVNEVLKPDLVICLHFNAESWGEDPSHPEFVARNHLHLLVNGCYSALELRNDDIRFEMLHRLLERTQTEEIDLAQTTARALATATGLPAYSYTTPNALRVSTSPYVWARNLLANRLYHAPVLYLEPYVMNSQEIWERVQAGDYEGERLVAGVQRKSLYREYADSVAEGVRVYFTAQRR